MISFTLINNFDQFKKYKYGLNFEISNWTTNFITSSISFSYKSLLNAIISPKKGITGQINFDKYEILGLDNKMHTRFLYDQLEIYSDDIFYDENLSVRDFFKENWILNHLNTKEFEIFFETFVKEMGFGKIANFQIKNLTKEQKDIVGLSLAIFNKKKYLIINKELNSKVIYNHQTICNFLKKLNNKEITILWFTKNVLDDYLIFNQIDIDKQCYDCLNKKFILHDEIFLASKFCLTVKKWFKMTTIIWKRMNIVLSIFYGIVATLFFSLSLFFANKPISLLHKPIGFIKDNQTSLMFGVIFLICLLVLIFFFSFRLYRCSKPYIKFLLFNGVSRIVINFLICFIILIFGCSVILSSYIILLIAYSGLGILEFVKWISSIYFPISFLFLDIGCCIICANMIKNNLLDNKISKFKISLTKNV